MPQKLEQLEKIQQGLTWLLKKNPKAYSSLNVSLNLHYAPNLKSKSQTVILKSTKFVKIDK